MIVKSRRKKVATHVLLEIKGTSAHYDFILISKVLWENFEIFAEAGLFLPFDVIKNSPFLGFSRFAIKHWITSFFG